MPLRLSLGFLRRVFRVAGPVVIGELSESLYSVVDTFFISLLGYVAVAAVGISGYLSWVLFSVTSLVFVGTQVLVAQSVGAGRPELGESYLANGIYLAITVMTPLAIVSIALVPYFLTLLGTPASAFPLAVEYLRIRFLSIPIVATSMVLNAAFVATERTKASMVGMLSGTLTNAVLDPILIFGVCDVIPALGVKGAAWATVAGSLTHLGVLLTLALRGWLPLRLKFHKPSARMIEVLRVGVPASLERVVVSLSSNVYVSFIARAGDVALAAHTIGLRVESFVYMPGIAFSYTAASLVGQEVGGGRVGNAKRLAIDVTKVAVVIMTLTGLLLVLISPYVPWVFTNNPEVARLCTIYLVLAGLSEPGLAAAMVLAGSFRGAGNVSLATAINLLGITAFRLIPAAILSPILGAVGAWIGMFIDVYARGFTFLLVLIKYFETKVARKLV